MNFVSRNLATPIQHARNSFCDKYLQPICCSLVTLGYVYGLWLNGRVLKDFYIRKFHKLALILQTPKNFSFMKMFCYTVRSLEETLKLSFVLHSKFASVIQEPSRYKRMLMSQLCLPCLCVIPSFCRVLILSILSTHFNLQIQVHLASDFQLPCTIFQLSFPCDKVSQLPILFNLFAIPSFRVVVISFCLSSTPHALL